MRPPSMTAQKWLLGAAAAIVPTTALASYLWFREPDLDAHLCAPGSRLPAHHVLVIDRTDPPSDSEGQAGALAIARLKGDLRKRQRLTIYEVNGAPTGPPAIPHFDRCHPGDGSDVTPLFNSVRRLRQRYQTEFEAPLTAVVERLSAPRDAAVRTPLLQALHRVFTSQEFLAPTDRRSLTVFSDLIVNDDKLNMYTCRPFAFTGLARWDYVAALDGALAAVEVRVRRLTSRPTCVHPPSFRAFWTAFWHHARPKALDQSFL